MFEYAKLFSILPLNTLPNTSNEEYILNFTWHDPNEAKKIIQDTLNLTSKNLKNKIFDEFYQTLELRKKVKINKDNERLYFLNEQTQIAKTLNISSNTIDEINLDQLSVSYFNSNEVPYYLRGYLAIDKEIELIQNRNYSNFEFFMRKK